MVLKNRAALACVGISFGIALGGCSKAPTNGVVDASNSGATAAAGADSSGKASGPVRMARISYVTGPVSWRPDGTTGWTNATINMPLRQGAELSVNPGSRLELQFDDGGTVRLGNGAVATLQTLYADNQGEFTELKLQSGIASCHLKDKYGIYQVDSPYDSVKATGPADFRINVRGNADGLAVRTGSATLTEGGRDTVVPSGHYCLLDSSTDPATVRTLGGEDQWDHFNDNRNVVLDEAPAHVPSDIAIVSGGLDRHGDWQDVNGYGWVWHPRVDVGWRPYERGHWAWVDPYGWTWVSSDPWGWAPYHYGTWAHFGFGWGWCPGPRVQAWSPAVVDFASDNGYVTWAPLAPAEVTYPALSIGFGGGDWWLSFSIGSACVYEPYDAYGCRPVFFPDRYDDPGWRSRGWESGGWGHDRFAASAVGFVPRNAEFGAIGVRNTGFGAQGQFTVFNRNARPMFGGRNQLVANRQAYSGPVGIHPGSRSFTPSGRVVNNYHLAALNRPVVRGRLAANVERASGRFGPTVRSSSRSALAIRRPGTVPSRMPAGVAAARQSIGFRGRTGAVAGGRTLGRVPSMASRGANRGAARGRTGPANRTPGRVPRATQPATRRAAQNAAKTGRRAPANRSYVPRSTANRGTTHRNTNARGAGHAPAKRSYVPRSNGNRNTGNRNTGKRGGGHTSIPRSNGNRNTGNRNTGNRGGGRSFIPRSNGNRNTGNRNTGNRGGGRSFIPRSTGNRNTGNRNTGNRGGGNRNTGNRNSGGHSGNQKKGH